MSEIAKEMTPIEHLQLFHREGRIIRGRWMDVDANGRALACWYAALGVGTDPATCPASLLPQWAATMLPTIDDNISKKNWADTTSRFVATAPGWALITPAGWRRVLAKTMIEALEIAAPHDTEGVVVPMLRLWHRVLDGDEPAYQDWISAAREAWAARAAAAAAARMAVRAAAAAWAPRAAAANAAADAVAGAAAEAEAEADAADAASSAAAAAAGAPRAAAAEAARVAAAEAAWDRIADAFLSAIEAEIAEAETDGAWKAAWAWAEKWAAAMRGKND